ncbi:MAG: hypothetical protein AAFQ67_04375 [Pseudomonadota bacterium]
MRRGLGVRRKGGAGVVMVLGAEGGEGVTSIAASLALDVARRTNDGVWLVDLNFRKNAAAKGFAQGFAGLGGLGAPYRADLGVRPLHRIDGREAPSGLLEVRQAGCTNLFVTRFRNEAVAASSRLEVVRSPEWWTGLRRRLAWVIVDAPALSASSAALTAAADMDSVILVADQHRTDVRTLARAAEIVRRHGGQIAGVVSNCPPRASAA